MARTVSKEGILDAAEQVVMKAGPARMTLDAVAEQAHISKGGLTYVFPSKEALLEGMIERMASRIENQRAQIRQELADEHRENELLVEIRSIEALTGENYQSSMALMAVVANQPELAKVMRENLKGRLFENIACNDQFLHAGILFYAALGIHFHDLFHLSLLEPAQKKALFGELIRLASASQER